MFSKSGDERYEPSRRSGMRTPDNTFYRLIPVTTHHQEPYSFEDFKRALIRNDTRKLWVPNWSERSPFVTFTEPLRASNETVRFICHGGSSAVKEMTWKEFYGWCKRNPGLTEFVF